MSDGPPHRRSRLHPWTHARIDGTQINGWIYDGNLSNSGALERC
ncbi:hypothetical protein [Streptomyces hydrogenans]